VVFVLAISFFVLKFGIAIDLPVAEYAGGIRFNDRVLKITLNGIFFFNDEQVTLFGLEDAFCTVLKKRFGIVLILEVDGSVS